MTHNKVVLSQNLIKSIQDLQDRTEREWSKKNNHDFSLDTLLASIQNYFVVGTKLGYFNEDNFDVIAKKLYSIPAIKELPQNQRGIFGVTTQNNEIYFNPSIPRAHNLPDGARSIMYLYHELGHVITMQDVQQLDKYIAHDEILRGVDPTLKPLARDGRLMLEEFVVQNIAEDICYTQFGIPRPKQTLSTNSQIYGVDANNTTISIASRLDYYTEFEGPALAFAQTLKGVGVHPGSCSDAEYIDSLAKDFCRKAMSPNCWGDIVTEYIHGPISNDTLFYDLVFMGYICNAKYQSIGSKLSVNGTIDKNRTRQCYYSLMDDLGKNADFDHRDIDWSAYYPPYLDTPVLTRTTELGLK